MSAIPVNPEDESSDAVLIRRAQRGEEPAFADLVRRHLPAVRAFIAMKLPVAHLADELSHETFVFAFAAAKVRQMRVSEGVEFRGAGVREIPAQRGAFLGEGQLPERSAFLRGSRTEQDIGAPGKRGSSSVDPRSGVWTAAGGGADINGASDQFHFVSQDFLTDGTIVAKVTAVEKTDEYSKAGLMIRGSMNADAPYAFVFFGPSTVGFEFRTAAGSNASHAPWSQTPYVGFATAPMWVKLVRRGGVFAAYYGKDGVTWTQLGAPATIVMSAAARAGLAVTAHNDAALNHSTFENVSAQP